MIKIKLAAAQEIADKYGVYTEGVMIISYLLGYAMKALTEQDTPLHEQIEMDMCTSIFYIYDFIFDEPYRDSEFMTEMVEQIPNLSLYTLNALAVTLSFGL